MRVDLIMGRVVSGCQVKNLGSCLTRDTVGSSRVGSDSDFLVIIFGLGRGFFLSSSENFDPCPTRRMVGSGFSVGFIESGGP
jgi:hypothetical protein